MTVEMITAIGALLAGAAGIVSAILLHQKTVALLEQRLGQVTVMYRRREAAG